MPHVPSSISPESDQCARLVLRGRCRSKSAGAGKLRLLPFVVAVFLLWSSSGFSALSTVYHTEQQNITGFEFYQKGLFWWAGLGNCPADGSTRGIVQVQGVLGGSPRAVAAPVCRPAHPNVVRDDAYVYFVENGRHYRKALNAAAGDSAQLLPTSVSAGFNLGAVMLWKGRLYWTQVPPAGGYFDLWSNNPDGTDQQYFLLGIFGAGSRILKMEAFFHGPLFSPTEAFCLLTEGGALLRYDVNPRGTSIATLATGISDFAIRNEVVNRPFPELPLRLTSIYAIRDRTELLTINAATGSATHLYPPGDPGINQLSAVAVDSRNLYVIQQPVPCEPLCIPNGFSVHRQLRPIDDLNNSRPWDLIDLATPGTDPGLILSDPAVNLRSDGQRLFWALGRTLRTLPTDAPRLELDFRAVGLEAVQAVQDFHNSVRLVANKRTYVRGYAATVLSPPGLGPFFPNATLRGSRNGQDLGSLNPLNSAKVDGTADLMTLRRNLNRSFLFELPPSWVQRGQLTLELEVNGNLGLPETVNPPLANNRASTPAIQVVGKGSPCLLFVPMHAHAPNYWPGDDPAFGSILDRARSVLPLEDFRLHFRTDRISLPVLVPKIEIVCSPIPPICVPIPYLTIEYRAFEFPGDENAALNYLRLYYTFESNPAGCPEAHFVGTVHPSVGGWNGIGSRPGHNLIVRMAGASFTSPIGGMTLAHELGHNFDLKHIASLTTCFGPCSDFPDGPYDFYPGDHCALGETDENNPAALFGFDPLTRQVIRPNAAADFMTYECSAWASKHNWDRLIGSIPGFQPASASAPMFAPASVGSNDPVLLVQGMIDRTQNTAELWPFYQLPAGTFDAMKIAAAFAAALQPNTDCFIRFLDSGDALLGEWPLVAEPSADGDSSRVPLTHFVPFDARARRIQLVRQGAVIAERFASANAPVVTPGVPMFNPNAQTLDWNWTATDADRDPLIFAIQYSPDNGLSWQSLQVGYPALSVTLNPRMLPGGTQARLRVIASDGVNSTVAPSAPFVLPRHPPEVIIYGAREGERLPFGTFSSLRGLAIDAEDGSLPPADLRWSLAGPVSLTATGESLAIGTLSPGLYAATLAATDFDNQTNQALRRFEIQPVSVPEAATAPVLDGQAADAAYTDATVVRFLLAPGRFATARLVHSGSDLYICFSDLDYSLGEIPAVGVRIDANASRNATAQADDAGYFVNLDAIPFQEMGDGASMMVTLSPRAGFAATVTAGQNAWNAELRIADSLLGGWNHAAGIMFAFKPHASLAEEARWPVSSASHQPVTWAPAYFGTPPVPVNLPPVAHAGPNRTYSLIQTQAIFLDGSASFDPDGSALTYSWTQIAGPSTTLSNASSATPSLLVAGSASPATLRFRLVVNDGTSNSAPDELSITVQGVLEQKIPGVSVRNESDGSVTADLVWPGAAGDRVIVQASSNLVQWVSVASNTVDWVRRILYRDIQAGLYPYRFYRLASAPEAAGCIPAPDHLVGWWRAENDATDAAGSNHGTLLKGLSFAPGRAGQALNFNSANQALLVPQSARTDVGASGGITFEGWINPADTANQYPIAEWGNGPVTGTHFWINVNFGGAGGPGALYAAPHFGDQSYFASAPGVITPNAWQHVAFTFDQASGMARLFHNGIQVGFKNAGPVALQTGLPLYFGHRLGGPTFRGLLDEMALYNRALNSNEIRAVFLAGVAGKCAPVCGAAPVALTQDFEAGPPVDYSLSQHVTAPGPVVRAADAGSTGAYLRLINDGINSQNNAVAFAQSAPGFRGGFQAEFDFRLFSTDAPADGFAFMLIPAEVYGTNGPGYITPIAFEEPNIAGVFAVGFDVHPRTEPRNDVSVHWNGVEHANVTMADANINLTSGSFHRAVVSLAHVNGGALVTVTLVRDINGSPSPAYTPIRDLFIPGLNPFSGRVEFAGRTGGLDMNVDLDNVRLQALPPCLTAP